MNIHFYLDDEHETPITSFYDLVSNPFKVGDDISIEIEDLYPSDYNKLKEEIQLKRILENKELENKFERKKIRIVREGKYLKFKVLGEPRLTIEYHCVYLNEK